MQNNHEQFSIYCQKVIYSLLLLHRKVPLSELKLFVKPVLWDLEGNYEERDEKKQDRKSELPFI